jgi:hypothetical protein
VSTRREEREALRRALGPAVSALDAGPAPTPSGSLVRGTLRRATAELRAETNLARSAAAPSPAGGPWPVGFRRELARLLAVTLVPGAAVLALNLAVLLRAPGLLERWLPEALATALPTAYALGALGWLSLVVGSLPFLAHRRATARPPEVPG